MPNLSPFSVLIPVASISSPSDRYRFGDWDEDNCARIATDIARPESGGLLQPIVLSADGETYILRAGGHRYGAFLRNAKLSIPCPFPEYQNWTLIPAIIGTDFDENTWTDREIVENDIRKTLPWFAQARKIYAYHMERKRADLSWGMTQTANSLSLPPKTVRAMLSCIGLWHSTDPADGQMVHAIQEAATLEGASRVFDRWKERNEEARIAREQAEINSQAEAKIIISQPVKITTPATTPTEVEKQIERIEVLATVPQPSCPILNTPLSLFTESYSGPSFNFLHVDPPYGQEHGQNVGQNARKDFESYDDDAQDLWKFLEELSTFCAFHVSDSAHMLLWFPTEFSKLFHFEELRRELFSDWKLERNPFIWLRGSGEGRAIDTQRDGRSTYEWALRLTRGDRKIVKVKELHFTSAGGANKIHTSEKDFLAVRHICEMYVDSTTRAFDPTAGSGRPLQAIKSLGGEVTGLEKVEAIWEIARKDWERFLKTSGPAL